MSNELRTEMIHGLMAEFDNPTDLVGAADRARLAGYTLMDAYSPFPIEELDDALGLKKNRLPLITLLGGIFGGLGGYALQYWTQVIAWPMNIGGRPFDSWPHFIPVTFECTVLGASIAAFVGMLGLNGLPKPYHPVFNVRAFDRASRDRFFLCIESTDPKFDRHATGSFLKGLHPLGVSEVAA
jgi:Protein of unknown function (DUF3341)